MPPKTKKNQPTKCLKFGEILMDENRKTIFLCAYCTDFTSLQNFQDHLKNCNRVRHIFKVQKTSTKLKCDTDETKLLTKIKKDTKELLVYGFDNNRSIAEDHVNDNGDIAGLLGIEEELLNPRWYTDTTTSAVNDKNDASYNDLIEEVTPFVQFKENVKSNSTGRVTRISAKEQVVKDQNKSINDAMKINHKPSTPGKLFLSDDKKQVLRRAIEEKPKSLEISKKPIPQVTTQATKDISDKTMLRPTTKKLIVVQHTTNTTPLSTGKVSLKRKAGSLPVGKASNDCDQNHDSEVKRRRTMSHQATTQSKPKAIPTPIPASSQSSKQNAKSINLTSPNVLSIQDVVVVSKNENQANRNTKKPVALKSQIEIFNNNQLPSAQYQQQKSPQNQQQKASQNQQQKSPQNQQQKASQQQQQKSSQQLTKLQGNPSRVQPSSSLSKPNNHLPLLTNNNPKTTQMKETPQVVQKVVHSTAINTTPPIERKVQITHSVPKTPSATTQNNQKTAEILNKLQTLGLKVQRTNPPPESNLKFSPATTNERALEIIKKLQSKGMNVKIVQKSNITPVETLANPFKIVHYPMSTTQPNYGNTVSSISSISTIIRTTPATAPALKPNFHKNISIKKCN